MKYIKPLDGFRAIAVILVIFRHWNFSFLKLEFGWIGVNFFFVLSGFLIASILLEDKKNLSFAKYIKLFYIKRTLRIFPIYYFYLIGCILLLFFLSTFYELKFIENAYIHLKHNLALLSTYTYNFNIPRDVLTDTQVTHSKFFNHLWSLAVEEQFYLFFPFIAYFFNKKTLKYLMIAVITLSPVLRYVVAEHFLLDLMHPAWAGLTIYENTLTQLDALAMGVLLATINLNKITLKNSTFVFTVLSIVVFLLSVVFALRYLGVNISYKSLSFQLISIQLRYHTQTLLDYYYTISFTIVNSMAVLIIVACLKNLKSIKILNNKYLVKIGQISYGIYLYHSAICLLFFEIGRYVFGVNVINNNALLEIGIFILFLITTYLVSTISFKYIEKPFLRIKSNIVNKHLH